jgi:hypothetical protein
MNFELNWDRNQLKFGVERDFDCLSRALTFWCGDCMQAMSDSVVLDLFWLFDT